MNEFHLPHVEDLTTNAKLPGQLTEDFRAIEQEDLELRKDMKSDHDDLANKINEVNKRLDELMNGGGM